jgi:hypothetical protein
MMAVDNKDGTREEWMILNLWGIRGIRVANNACW